MELVDAALSVAQVIEAEIRESIEVYQTATVMALQDNAEAIEKADLLVQGLLARAHVLPDGRRVFRSEDGERVFDEFGERIAPEQLDPP